MSSSNPRRVIYENLAAIALKSHAAIQISEAGTEHYAYRSVLA